MASTRTPKIRPELVDTEVIKRRHKRCRRRPSKPGVAKVLAHRPEVACEPVFVARGRFSECKRM